MIEAAMEQDIVAAIIIAAAAVGIVWAGFTVVDTVMMLWRLSDD